MTKTQPPRQDEEQPADEKQNIANIVNVIVIVFLIKCNESYGEKINNISNNSVGGLLKPAKSYKPVIDNKYARYIDLPEQSDHNANITFIISPIGNDKIKKYPIPQYLNSADDCIYLINGTSYSVNNHSELQNNKPTTTAFSQTTILAELFPNIHNLFNRKKNIDENINRSQENKEMKILRKKVTGIHLNEPLTYSNNYSINNITRQSKELHQSTNDAPNTSSLIFNRGILKNINESESMIITKKNSSDKHEFLTNYTKNDWKIKLEEINTNMKEEEERTRDSTKLDSDAGYIDTSDSMKELKQVHRFKRQDLPPKIRKIYKPAQNFPGKINIKNMIQKKINNGMSTKLPEELIKEIRDIAKRLQKNKFIATSVKLDINDQLKNTVTMYNGLIRRTMKKFHANHGKFPQNNTFAANGIESAKNAPLIEQRQSDTSVAQNNNKGTVIYQWQRVTPKRSLINKPPRGGTLKIKRLRDAVKVNVGRNNALINKRKKTTIKNRRLKDASINKGSRVHNIKTIQVKSVENKQQQHTRESTKGEEKSFTIDNINATFSLTTEITELIQSPTRKSNEFIVNDHIDLMSEQSNQLVLKQHSLSNDQLANKFLLSNIAIRNPEHLMTEMANNEMPVADIMQPVFQTLRFEDTQTVIQSDYLPGFYDLDNANNNISIKSMPFAPSEVLHTNKTMKKHIKNISTKKISRKGKHSKNSKHFNEIDPSAAIVRKHIKKTKSHKKGHTTKGKRDNGKKRLQKNELNAAKASKHYLKVEKATINDKSYRSAKPPKKFSPHKPTNMNVKASGENVQRSKASMTKKIMKNVSGKSRQATDTLPGFTPYVLGKSLDLINRTAELQFRQRDSNYAAYDTVGGIFNSYNNNWNNDNNFYYYASSAITDRNNVNNLIVINFDTTPEPTTFSPESTPMEEEEPEVTCPSAVRPTVTFLKRTGFMDYNVVVAALFIGSLMLLFLCCCCCAPIIIIRRKRCETQ